jgi:hypothetical protein
MAYHRQYQTGISWENDPSVNTPLNASNLNHMDNGIMGIDEAVDDALTVVDSRISYLSNTLNQKQNKLTFDERPTINSANPVTSRGIFKSIADAIISGGGGGYDAYWDVQDMKATFVSAHYYFAIDGTKATFKST